MADPGTLFTVDLANCDREPIHLPGSIQPHGVLLVLAEPDLVVELASDNAGEWLGVASVLGKPVGELLGAAAGDAIGRGRLSQPLALANPLELKVGPPLRPVYGVLHRSEGRLILELEPVRREIPSAETYHLGQHALARLQASKLTLDLCRAAVAEVRAMTGFDRVMAYRFDADDHGHVIAESRRAELVSYLDLHYPAADIPAQARRLYVLNWLRIIPDIDYAPCRLVGAGAATLDLSHSVLRSVSPIHVEYLKNISITASMSISLVVDGRLWGMIICHHHSGPKHVEYPLRQACEFLAQVLSWQVATRERAELAEESAHAQRLVGGLVERLAAASHSIAEVLAAEGETLLGLVGARGAVIHFAGKTELVGQTPPGTDLAALVAALEPHLSDRPYAVHSLATLLPEARHLEPIASGVLAIGLGHQLRDGYVIWLRPEMLETVRWVADPRKLAHLRDAPERLSPERSFALWRETVRGRALRWNPAEIDAVASLQRALRGSLAARAVEMTKLAEELRLANLAKDEFLAVVSHELRTPLSAMLGWTRMLRDGQLTDDKRAHALEVIERNGLAQAKLIEDLLDVSRIISGKLRLDVQSLQPIEFVQAAIDAVRPSADAKAIQLSLQVDPGAGPLMGDPARLQQVTWNLLSNAIKFTAKGGKVRVVLERVHSYVDLSVTDSGEGISADFLPHVFERFRQSDASRTRKHKGLGLGLSIVRHLVELHGGQVTARSDGPGHGATFTVRLPLTPLHRPAPAPAGSPEAAGRSELPAPPSLAGLRVLIVDDEPDARDLLAAILARAGMVPVTAESARVALTVLDAGGVDLVLSDVGMPDLDGYGLIESIRRRPAAHGGQVPAVALTAYSRIEDRARALLAGFEAHVAKPIDAFELLAVLTSVSRRLVR